MEMLIDKITNCFQNKKIQIDDIDLFKFGLKSILNNLILIIALLILSISLTKIPFYTMIFTCSFFYLREFCGGFHLNSKVKCFLFSLVILLCVPYVTINNLVGFRIVHIIFIITAVCVVILAPIDHPNKKLKEDEKMYFRKKLKIRWCILMFILMIIAYFKIDFKLLYILEMSMITNCLSMISASKIR